MGRKIGQICRRAPGIRYDWAMNGQAIVWLFGCSRDDIYEGCSTRTVVKASTFSSVFWFDEVAPGTQRLNSR